MTTLEIILLVCGIACIIASFVFSNKEADKEERQIISTELTEKQKQDIKKQISNVISEELEAISEKTEITLDKISNTKIMEMNEYAETILGEINRNHNETVFLYDMLNEKAKEVKSTVKDVNITKRQVERIQAEFSTTEESAAGTNNTVNVKKQVIQAAGEDISQNIAKQRLSDIVRKSAEEERKEAVQKAVENVKSSEDIEMIEKIAKEELAENAAAKSQAKAPTKESTKAPAKTPSKSKTAKTTAKTVAKQVEVPAEEVVEMNIQFEKGANNNDRILKLYSDGKSNKEIAKELNLGVGEVKLVIDLYNSGK